MDILFADTAVQLICVPLEADQRFANAGHDWQRARCKGKDAPTEYPYIQWHIRKYGDDNKLFLAVDTTCGDEDHKDGDVLISETGYFCRAGSLFGDYKVSLAGLLGTNGQPLVGLPEVSFIIRPATAEGGDAKDVHMVVDFGNNRSGALLLEFRGEIAQTPIMTPFELLNRYRLDSWDAHGNHVPNDSARWFSSKTHWCTPPYLPPPSIDKIEYQAAPEAKGGFWSGGKGAKPTQVTRKIVPKTFQDLSMVRMGREADELALLINTDGDVRTGASSPKRYLWADDESWLEGANWHMFDPYNRFGAQTYASTLKGPLLTFIPENDSADDPEPRFEDAPSRPRHAPRSLMTAALYELLCQAYVFINSPAYRQKAGDAGRKRRLRSLTLTYPTGMIQPEKDRFKLQAQKAIKIFSQTLGRKQELPPELTLSIDEASAVHLTYIWSELRMLGQDPRLWFAALSRKHGPSKALAAAAAETTEEPEGRGAVAAGRRRNRGRITRPGGVSSGGLFEEDDSNVGRQELRIACIDIGGGTTDLMIARYRYEPGIDDSIEGQVLHRDGVSIAGDQLVKRLLEKIIVPAFSEAIGLEVEDIQLLFGPEVPKNRGFGSQRVDWINRLFMPLAERYLQLAVDGIEDEAVTHHDGEVVDPLVLESLEQVCNKLRGPGYYNVRQEMRLFYNRAAFKEVGQEVFDDLLFDFCGRIVNYQADVILLAGQPTKLGFLQDMIRTYVPLPASRIIPMFNHYAGNWYPYQDNKGHAPGIIVDPKSAVVVGAAIEFLARNGLLPQFKFTMRGKDTENTYYWGVMTESTSTIRDERVLFKPPDEDTRDEWIEFKTIAQRVNIGRKMVPDETAQASPIYVLKMDTGDRIGQTQVTVKIRRNRASEDREEHLEVDSVSGSVAGMPAILGENVHFTWRTLADERYFLDTGGLDNIELQGV